MEKNTIEQQDTMKEHNTMEQQNTTEEHNITEPQIYTASSTHTEPTHTPPPYTAPKIHKETAEEVLQVSGLTWLPRIYINTFL